MDDDDKVRRNLVMASSAVTLFSWLDIPPGLITAKILGVTPEAFVSGWKIWAAIFAVLAYLSLRFYFSVVSDSEWVFVGKNYHQKQINAIDAILRSQLDAAGRARSTTGTVLQRLDTTTGQPVALDAELNSAIPNAKWDRISPSDISYTGQADGYWTGKISAVFLDGPVPRGTGLIDFKLGGIRKLSCELRALSRLDDKKIFMDVGAPVMLAYVAFLLAAYHFGATLF